MNCTDFLEGGLGMDDAIPIARGLERKGIDALELSGGTLWGMRVQGDVNRSPFRTVPEEAYYREEARRLKRETSLPIILTGGIRRYEAASELIGNGAADYIGLCRPLIREPDLLKRWQRGDAAASACVSDNACFKPIAEGKGSLCVRLKSR